jgi:MinD-like ATPase involved in chromosome partitioning or flagellar assembly
MTSPAKFVAIAASEPGAGRSLCTASIAVSLAKHWRCLVLDLDAGSGNLQKLLGMGRPGNLDYLPLPFSNDDTERLLNVLRSATTDYAMARLPVDMKRDTAALFAAADVPVVVTQPEWAALEKVVEFLKRCDSCGLDKRRVYMIVNRVERGGEQKVAAAFVKKIQKNLGLDVSILGTVPYDSSLESIVLTGAPPLIDRPQGPAAMAFEDIAYRIERDAAAGARPRTRKKPQEAQEPRTTAGLQTISDTLQRMDDLETAMRAVAGQIRRLDERFSALEMSTANFPVSHRRRFPKRGYVLAVLGALLAVFALLAAFRI